MSPTTLDLPALAGQLGEEDDPRLWDAVLGDVLGEIEDRWPREAPATRRIHVCLACVSAWRRPHQSRWIADGGYAWPESYGRHDHENADWKVWLERGRDDGSWSVRAGVGVPRRRRREVIAFVCVPALSTRHGQAAISIEWAPAHPWPGAGSEDRPRAIVGFRKSPDGAWTARAHEDRVW